MQKKIFLEKGESVEDISERVIAEKSKKIILHISESSSLFSLEEFEDIKKRTQKKKKEVLIESKSPLVLKNAEEAGFSVINASLGSHKRPFIDITPKKSSIVSEKKEIKLPDFFSYVRDKDDSIVDGVPEEMIDADTEEEREDFRFERSRKRIKGSRKFFSFIGIFILLLCIIGLILYYILPRATITITLKKTPVEFNEIILVSSKASDVQITDGKITIPGELFTARRNLEIPFTSTSTEHVEEKATGKLTVYNAYSSASQKIIATTRFVSPSGKLFRLDNAVTIPGAKVVGGKLTPSSIEVSVTADKAGEEYNIGPTKPWTIPGFEGSDKYNGFYAESKTSMNGGFIGEKPVVGNANTDSAKEIISSALKDALEGEMAVLMSDKYTLLSGASSFVLEKQDIRPLKDDPSSFSLFGEASMKQIVFNESVLRDAISSETKPKGETNFDVFSFTFKNINPKIDLDKGTEVFNASGTIVFEEHIDKKAFADQILGMSEDTLKSAVFALPGLEKASIALWPFWVHEVPTNQNKVTITFE